MTRWSKDQLAEYMTQRQDQLTDDKPDQGPESRLQAKCLRYLKDKGYPVLNFRQSQKARGFLTPGWPDMTICLPNGRTVYVELKAAKGYVKAEQKQIHLQMMQLRHEIYIVKSYKRFLEIMKGGE